MIFEKFPSFFYLQRERERERESERMHERMHRMIAKQIKYRRRKT